jgi:hypothetical protein
VKRSQSTPLLLAMLGLIAGLVILDRTGLLPGRSPADEGAAPTTPRARYLLAASELQQERAIISQAGPWRRELDSARQRWAALRAGMVRAATPELAESRLREVVLDATAGLELASPTRVSYVRDAAPLEGDIRPIAVRVEFDAVSHRDALAAIDRLAHLPGVRTEVVSLRVQGPGRVLLPEQLTISLTLRALALVGEEG